MNFYRVQWGEWGEDDAWNTIYVSCNILQLNFPEEKSVDELEQIVYQKIVDAHGHYPKNVVRLSATEAEVLKYFNNVYAALRVTFANNFFEICEKLDCDYTAIKDAYIKTGKAVDMYLDASPELRGYSGMCLPKDTKAIINLLEDLNLNHLTLIKSIDEDNNQFRKTVFNGMRGEE